MTSIASTVPQFPPLPQKETHETNSLHEDITREFVSQEPSNSSRFELSGPTW
jgi:hypothetical protein